MKKEEIATLIGQLKYLQTDYIKQLDIIEKYINILDRFTWTDVPKDEEIFRNENKYIFNEIDEFLLKHIKAIKNIMEKAIKEIEGDTNVKD